MGRRINWERSRQEAQATAARIADDKPVYPRQGERSDQWLLRCVRFPSRCLECNEEIVKGERAWMQRAARGWEFLHEQCRME